MKWAFTVVGVPEPWERVIPVRNKETGAVRMVKPGSVRAFQRKVALCAKAAGVVRLAGHVELLIVAYLRVDPIAHHSGDWDNFGKLASDALNGIAWEDDRQVVRGSVVKEQDPENPRMEVFLKGTPATETVQKSGRLSPSYSPPPV